MDIFLYRKATAYFGINRNRICFFFVLALNALIGLNEAVASTILQDHADFKTSISGNDPIGQSFIAEDPYVLFAFYFEVINVDEPNEPLTFRLLDGSGLDGNVLTTIEFVLPTPPTGTFTSFYYDINLSAVTLEVGHTYTASISASDDLFVSNLWGIHHTSESSGDLYAGGQMFYTNFKIDLLGCPSDSTSCDTRFRVTPVPIPPTIWLFGTGFLGLFEAARRKKAV